MRGVDAERDQRARLSKGRGARHREDERCVIADQVIGRKHEQHGIAVMSALRPQRRERHCGRRVAAERLEEVRSLWRKPVAHAGVRILRVKVVLAVGDRHEVGDARDRERPGRSLG
jgi:hypothetical protein